MVWIFRQTWRHIAGLTGVDMRSFVNLPICGVWANTRPASSIVTWEILIIPLFVISRPTIVHLLVKITRSGVATRKGISHLTGLVGMRHSDRCGVWRWVLTVFDWKVHAILSDQVFTLYLDEFFVLDHPVSHSSLTLAQPGIMSALHDLLPCRWILVSEHIHHGWIVQESSRNLKRIRVFWVSGWSVLEGRRPAHCLSWIHTL